MARKVMHTIWIVWSFLMYAAYVNAGPPPGGYLDEMKYPNIITPQSQFGTYGTRPGQLIEPMAVAVGPDDQIYITECGTNRVQVFSMTGTSLRMWGTTGSQPAQFICPEAIAVSSDRLVYIADTGNHRIQVFDHNGQFLRQWGHFGTAEGQLKAPEGLAVDLARVYVADTGNERIQVFSVKGDFLFSFGSYGAQPAHFNKPVAVTVDTNGHLYIADSNNNRVQKFDDHGHFLKAWGNYGSHNGGLAEPSDIAFQGGDVFLADLVNHRVQVFDMNGNFRYQWGRHPPKAHEGNGRLHYPMSLAVSPAGRFAVVCEPFENRCQVFMRDRIARVYNVDDSAWWVKATRFHYGTRATIAASLMFISEPDTHFVVVFDLSTTPPHTLAQFGGYGTDPGRFISPSGVAADLLRNVLYVSDMGNHRIQMFSLAQAQQGIFPFLGAFGSFGMNQGQFNRPGDLTIDQQGNLYVLDVHNNRIQVFSPFQQFLRSWGTFGNSAGQFNTPLSVSIDRTDAIVYVLDTYNYRIQAFDKVGNFLFQWGQPGSSSNAFVLPFGLVAGHDGFVYVTDQGGQKVKKFDQSGSFITEWGQFGTGNGEFYKPKGIAQDNGLKIYVVDFGNHRGQIFTPGGSFISAFGMIDPRVYSSGQAPPVSQPQSPVSK